MNILPLVISILMILSIITYTRFDTYQNFIIMQKEFVQYMTLEERKGFEEGAKQWYLWINLKESDEKENKENKEKKTQEKTASDASSKFPMQAFLDPETKEEESTALAEVLKQLIYTLFAEQNKFKELLQKDSSLVDQLLKELQEQAKAKKEADKPLKTIDALRNLEFNSHELNSLYYWMTKGIHLPSSSDISLEPDETKEEAPSDNAVLDLQRVSLLDYLTMNKAMKKIKIYLSPPVLLKAIFKDEGVVEEIRNKRVEYFNAINDENGSELSNQFKAEFEARSPPNLSDLLDFTVSKTDPRSYERKKLN